MYFAKLILKCFLEISDGCKSAIYRFSTTIRILEFAEFRKSGSTKCRKVGTLLHDNY